MGRKVKRDVLKRLDAARKGLFPHKTCPASRHVHIIVEGLLDANSDLARDLTGYEPEHMAESIASVLEGLWKARRWMRWQPNIEGDYMAGGEWVPDLEAIAAQGIPLREDPKGLRPKAGSPVGEADAPTPSDHTPSTSAGRGM